MRGHGDRAELRDAGGGRASVGQLSKLQSEGTAAEKTGLADNSVDLITAGQAFHWFDPEEAKKEFNRILGPEGWVTLIWNDRRVTGSPFLDAYEQLLRTQPEYLAIGHKTESELMHSGFFDGEPLFWSIPSYQEFDWEGLLGRARSSSYVPSPEQVEHSSFINRLRAVFDETQVGGKVAFEYETQMFVGKV